MQSHNDEWIPRVLGSRLISAHTGVCSNTLQDEACLISILSEHSHDPHLILHACKGLQRAANNYDSRKKIANLGAIPLMLQIMRENFSEVLITAACSVLRDLAVCPDNRRLIVSLGGLDTLLAAISSLNATNPLVACEALSLLVQNYENRVRLAELSPLPLLAETMNRHRSSLPILAACLTIVEGIGESRCMNIMGENQALPMSIAPILPALLMLMAEHRSDASIQESACKVLRAFTLNSSENQHLIVKENVLRALVTAMKTHPTVNSIQIHGRLALAAVSGCPGFTSILHEVADDPKLISYLQLMSSASSCFPVTPHFSLTRQQQDSISSSSTFSEAQQSAVSSSFSSGL